MREGARMYNIIWFAILALFAIENNHSGLFGLGSDKPAKASAVNKSSLPPESLNCIDSTNISISENGVSTLNPGYFVPPTYPNFAFLQLSIVGRPAPIINCDDVGHYLTAVVHDPIANVTCSSVFKVEDKLPPVFNCVTLELPCGIDVYSTPPPYTPLVSAVDNCTNPPTIEILTHTEKIFNCPSPYTMEIVRTYKATDASGNSSTCQDTVRFLRPILSQIVFPDDTCFNCDAFTGDTAVTGQPTWRGYPLTGVCATWFGYSDQIIDMGCPGRYKIRRTWNVMNECNGTSINHVQNIMSTDTTAPVITCPNDSILQTNFGSCVASYTFPSPQATDNCSTVITFQYKVDGVIVNAPTTTLSLGSHSIEVIANDGCYNTSSCTYNVTVEDKQGPSITCHDIIVSLNESGIGVVHKDSLDFDYFDNCSGPLTVKIKKSTSSTWSDTVNYTCAELGGNNILQFRVCDQYGNCTICEDSVTVQDKMAPMVDCGTTPVELNCTDFADFDPADYYPVATDNCGLVTFTNTISNGMNCNFVGDYTVTYTAMDASGNQASCSRIFHFNNTNPLDLSDITWPADVNYTGCNPDLVGDSISGSVILNGTFCNPIYIYSSLTDTLVNGSGCAVVSKEYVVIDSCVYNLSGGTQGKFTHTQFITSTGIIPPTISVPADVTVVPDDFINCTANVSLDPATASGCSTPITITNSFNGGGADASGDYPYGTTTVVYTATDVCGLTAQGSTDVTVEFATNDMISCPGDSTITCLNLFDSTYLPSPTIFNTCAGYTLDTLITGTIYECDNSELTVTYTITDTHGRSDACSFNITIQGPTPLTENDITWPDSSVVIECTQWLLNGYTITAPFVDTISACFNASISYVDSVIVPSFPGSVLAIKRVWQVKDDCFYDPNTGIGIFYFNQIIDVIDTTGPIVINYVDGDTINAPLYTDDCKILLDLSDLQILDCSPIVVQTHSINGGTPANNIDASGYYTLGVSTVNYYFEDIWGNGTNFTLYIQVLDSFPPTWPCPESLDVYINPNGLDTVYASQFSFPPFQAFDNCNYHDIYMTFDSTNLADSVLYLVCTGNVSDLSIQNLKVWVFDDVGLSTSCVVNLNVLEPPGQTTNCNHLMGVVGQLAADNGHPIPGAKVSAKGTVEVNQMSDAYGRYEIHDIPPGSDLSMSVEKHESAINGVNVSDIIAIRDHILAKKPLNNPYKLLAADVNDDGYVSVRDLLFIRKLILGYIDQYPSGLSWRFADKSYKFPNKKNPFNQPDVWQRQLHDVKGVLPVVDWVGIKLGDVNDSALFGTEVVETREVKPVNVVVTKVDESETEVTIRLIMDEIEDIQGIQFDMQYDIADLELTSLQLGDLSGIISDHFRVNEYTGSVSFVWDDEAGRNGNVIATLTFRKTGQGPVGNILAINDERIEAMAIDPDGKEHKVNLVSTGLWSDKENKEGRLLQNSPNPFNNSTVISVILAQSVKGKLTVYDATGRKVYTKTGEFSKGRNTIEIKAGNLSGSGIYIYRFESEIFTDTKKMILTL